MNLRRPWGLASAVAALATLTLPVLPLPAVAQSSGAARVSASQPDTPTWYLHNTGTSEEFRGLAAVDRSTAWISGEAGSVLVTQSGGASWKDVSPPQASGLALRDIEAHNLRHAVALSIGNGTDSSIFVTDDGGNTWKRTFANHDPKAFYDCMAIGVDGFGLALSDPVNGRFRLIETTDHGHSWSLLKPTTMPRALAGEFAFAASGTCLVETATGDFQFATGGAHPRVFHSTDRGVTWAVSQTPIRGGDAAGIYSLAFQERGGRTTTGVAVGGDYTDPTNGSQASAYTTDGGNTWTLSKTTVLGYRSGAAWATYRALAVGPTGSDISLDGGKTWKHYDDTSFDSVECTDQGACWASGVLGHVGLYVFVH